MEREINETGDGGWGIAMGGEINEAMGVEMKRETNAMGQQE